MRTRRDLLLAFGAAASLPLRSLAQKQGKVWRVGFLASLRRPDSIEADEHYGEFPRGMRELGYVEGKNLAIEWRFADGKYERFRELAEELVKLQVDVIVTDGTPPTIAAKKATSTIPIVFGSAGDPVGNGLVNSLSRPGGNATGISLITSDTTGKQLEMLISMVPRLSGIAVLLNPTNPYSLLALKGVRAAAEITKVNVFPVEARTQKEIEGAFAAMDKGRVGAFILTRDRLFFQERRQVAEMGLKHRLPGMGGDRYFPNAGGLMSYGQNLADNYRRAATYVDKIVKGAKPGDIPVEQPTTLELVINRRTARALGLQIPPELLLLADKLIE